MPWWGVILIAVSASTITGMGVVYYIGHNMFKNF